MIQEVLLKLTESKNENLSQQDFTALIAIITGHLYSFAQATTRIKWGESPGPDGFEKMQRENLTEDQIAKGKSFYQLMPDGIDNGFFNWYCDKRPNNQFFETKETCVLRFISFWYLFKHEQSL